MTNATSTILPSDTYSATTTSEDQVNYDHKSLHLTFDLTSVPDTDTVTPKVQGFDSTSGKYYDILVGTSHATTSTVTLKIGPGFAETSNVSTNNMLPLIWRVVVTHSASSNFVYSVGANLGG